MRALLVNMVEQKQQSFTSLYITDRIVQYQLVRIPWLHSELNLQNLAVIRNKERCSLTEVLSLELRV